MRIFVQHKYLLCAIVFVVSCGIGEDIKNTNDEIDRALRETDSFGRAMQHRLDSFRQLMDTNRMDSNWRTPQLPKGAVKIDSGKYVDYYLVPDSLR